MGKEKRSFAIIGLGAFGGTVAVELARYGNNVLGIDMDERSVAQMAPLASSERFSWWMAVRPAGDTGILQ